jgi:predicted dehydrogenase
MAKRLNVGLIGYQFMGKAHSNAYRQVGHFFDLPIEIGMQTICGRHAEAVEQARQKLGWEKSETDWRRVVEDPDIDIIDISTPGDSHHEICLAAAAAGKIVWCEKPIGNTLAQAREMLAAVEKAGVSHAVFHNYRKAPAVALAKKLIDDGRLGILYHMRATYLQDWIADPNFPMVWRLDKNAAGSGAHGDICSHIVDLGRFLMGEFQDVSGMLQTFIKQRPLPDGSGTGEVTVDDASAFVCRFANGGMGTFEASRFAVGRKNYNRFEINGSKGSVVFNLEKMNELEFYDNEVPEQTHGFSLIQVTEGSHPYAGKYWPTAHIIGYEHTFINLIADALIATDKGELPSPNFKDGVACQEVLEAVEASWAERRWVNI